MKKQIFFILILCVFLSDCSNNTKATKSPIACPETVPLTGYDNFHGSIYAQSIYIGMDTYKLSSIYFCLKNKLDSCSCLNEAHITTVKFNTVKKSATIDTASMISDLLASNSGIKKVVFNETNDLIGRFKKADTIIIELENFDADIDEFDLNRIINNSDSVRYIKYIKHVTGSLSKEANKTAAAQLLSSRYKLHFTPSEIHGKHFEYVEIQFVNTEKYFFKKGKLESVKIDTANIIR